MANPLDPSQAIDVKRRIGVVPEDLALYDLLTGRENLTFIGRMYQMERGVVQERIDELFALLELGRGAAAEKQIVLDYSHGMKKKLALAAALLPNPELLFLDEPFEGVDAGDVVPEDLALYEDVPDGARSGADRRAPLLELGRGAAAEKQIVLDYSHGMKKKLALAAALLPNPELLFLDEPFEGVDAVTSRIVRDLLTRAADRGSTIFITSHVLEIVERLCTHVGIIDQGRLVEQAPLAELRQSATLEETFLAKVGSTEELHAQLSWLDER